MELAAVRVDAVGTAGATGSAPLTGPGTVAIGPLAVAVERSNAPGGERWTWSVANRGDRPVAVRSVRLVLRVTGGRGPLRMFRNGYQSWSHSGVATLGVDLDPSNATKVPRLVRSMHHADEEVADHGELRSEVVTVLADGGPERLLVGFTGGTDHDGTLRLRDVDDGTVELAAEAFLGGAVLAPGEHRPLHAVDLAVGPDHSLLLERWAEAYGAAAAALVDSPYQVGWCSWYHYFDRVTEADLRSNLGHSADWPFDVFQLDDGYQATIGDWLHTNDTFPSDIGQLADAIAAEGRRPGLWIAPFVARPDAPVVRDHPAWVARYRDGTSRLVGVLHPVWGGETYTLDTTNPAVLDWLEALGRDLVDAGYSYLKLDFTYAPAADGVFHDPSRTPAQRVRAGFDAVRRGAGEDAFILGCGIPLGPVAGAVDGVRIGSDVAPHWHLEPDQYRPGAYERNEPATVNAWQNTLARSFLHRRLWLNDPDCLMLRQTETRMTAEAVRAWAHAVGVSGGMALVSDDLALLDADARALLDEVVALGRASDTAAIAGPPARCADLLDAPLAGRLAAAGIELVADPSGPTSTLTQPG